MSFKGSPKLDLGTRCTNTGSSPVPERPKVALNLNPAFPLSGYGTLVSLLPRNFPPL